MTARECPPLPPAPDGAAPYEYRSTSEQRSRIGRMTALLRDDLYERSGGTSSAVWTSPLKWSVEYGHMLDRRTWARVLGPDGKVYSETTDADEYWLDGAMP
jgi:hypothetical protein